ncbi:hypothetical protein ILUMI_08023 [Ignelater luminosus]|uniref:Cytochrome P450 n=1 Tax=Ignelater luminosus TaxID=2038154 RepID=A0A8K0GHF8_IGNLU|nr:hypothetical protein ILUMI_08023 [Ignelater luminosus]
MRLLKITFVKEADVEILKKHVCNTLKLRRKCELDRKNLIQFLMECDKQKEMLTDEAILSQVAGLFLASFDTPANLLAVLAYELAINQDIQDKLIKEVDEILKKCTNELSKTILVYLQLELGIVLPFLITETLRLWPTTTFTDRVSVKPYMIQPKTENEKPLQVDVGTYFWLPIYALHRDPKYFPNPTKFDPERFADKNKEKIQPYTFIPFGIGPRGCIASRFALLETKVIIFHILSKFRIATVEETEMPFMLSKKSINAVSDSGPVLGLQMRKTQ